MGSEWKSSKLEDCMDAIIDYRGKTPKKTTSGIPLITAKIIKNGRILPVTEYIAEEDFASWMRRGLPEPTDIVLTVEAPLGEVAQLDNRKIALAQRVITLRGKNNELNNNFLKYLLMSHSVQHELDGRATGTTVKGIKQSELRKITLTYPLLPEQKAIAHILGSLDNKIELNRKMNEILEAMAQALFKSWFVDFDPVIDNALAAGNPIPDALQKRAQQRQEIAQQNSQNTLDKNAKKIREMFPAEFTFTDELGWIPEGWEVRTISELSSKIQNGGTPKKSNDEYWTNGTIPWLTSGEVRQTIITNTEKFITKEGLNNSSAKWLPKNSTVIAMYGATAGQVALLTTTVTTNQAVCGVIPKEHYDLFNYLALSQMVRNFENLARGSAQQNISKGIIESMKFHEPALEVIINFNLQLKPVFQKWNSNLESNKVLSKLRDTLLPKLISGELRIPDAEKMIENI